MTTRVRQPKRKIEVVTLFPDMFTGPMTESLIGRAQKANLAQIRVHSLRKWSDDKRHAKVDDRPFGGGAGMLIRPEPVYRALKALGAFKRTKTKPWVILLTPRGTVLHQARAQKLSKKKHLILICGHYEGIDERVREWVDEDVSIGDFVLTGGEIPAMVLIDAVVRLIPGVVGDPASIKDESFSNGLLEYAQYTRPSDWRGRLVPAVLLSGHHREIQKWRKQSAVKKTRAVRSDLMAR